MIVDESYLSNGKADVVVIGGGPAGLTLARALANRGRTVLVIEAGGHADTAVARADCAGTVVDNGFFHPAPDLYRVRAIGGASRIWGGRCIPYDPIDFAPRSWMSGSGWPIRYEDVARHYPAAMLAAEAGSGSNDPSDALPGRQRELVKGLDSEWLHTGLERFSRPTNFWLFHRAFIQQSSHLHLLSGSIVQVIRLSANGACVEAVDVKTPSGKVQRFTASTFVMAGGGLEVARLLLCSHDVMKQGIGNGGDQVGRHYMSHFCETASVARFSPSASVAFDYDRDAENIYVRRRLCLTEKAQRQFELANTTFRTHLPDPGDPIHGDAILSAMFLAKALVQREYAAKLGIGDGTLARYRSHLANVTSQPLRLIHFSQKWMRLRLMARRKLPSVALRARSNDFPMEFHVEQEANPASRVMLGPARDRHGMHRLAIDWRPTCGDIARVQAAHDVFASALRIRGLGMLIYDRDQINDKVRRSGVVGGHHIGTAKMSAHEREGVVDRDCRVHGIANLYVASAAVLPTSSQANPTLTVLALALRLAERLTQAQSSVMRAA